METKKNKKDCDNGFHGDCCCNCAKLCVINKHPWNITEIAKGSILESFAYGCMNTFGDEKKNKIRSITFSDKLHGMCECHQRNK